MGVHTLAPAHVALELEFYFDGGGCNINGQVQGAVGEQRVKTVVAQKFEDSSAQHFSFDIRPNGKKKKCGVYPVDVVSSAFSEDASTPKLPKAVKFYFPGNGADSTIFRAPSGNDIVYDTPGRCAISKIFSHCDRPSYFNKLNLLYGTGWEFNLGKAVLAFFVAHNQMLQQQGKISTIKILGLSGGGIAAIAFSKALSDFYDLFPEESVPKIVLIALDPAAGPDYGKKTENFASVTYPLSLDLPLCFRTVVVDPRFVGQHISECHLFYAPTETNSWLEAQFPTDLAPETERPLVVPNNILTRLVYIVPHAHHLSFAPDKIRGGKTKTSMIIDNIFGNISFNMSAKNHQQLVQTLFETQSDSYSPSPIISGRFTRMLGIEQKQRVDLAGLESGVYNLAETQKKNIDYTVLVQALQENKYTLKHCFVLLFCQRNDSEVKGGAEVAGESPPASPRENVPTFANAIIKKDLIDFMRKAQSKGRDTFFNQSTETWQHLCLLCSTPEITHITLGHIDFILTLRTGRQSRTRFGRNDLSCKNSLQNLMEAMKKLTPGEIALLTPTEWVLYELGKVFYPNFAPPHLFFQGEETGFRYADYWYLDFMDADTKPIETIKYYIKEACGKSFGQYNAGDSGNMAFMGKTCVQFRNFCKKKAENILSVIDLEIFKTHLEKEYLFFEASRVLRKNIINIIHQNESRMHGALRYSVVSTFFSKMVQLERQDIFRLLNPNGVAFQEPMQKEHVDVLRPFISGPEFKAYYARKESCKKFSEDRSCNKKTEAVSQFSSFVILCGFSKERAFYDPFLDFLVAFFYSQEGEQCYISRALEGYSDFQKGDDLLDSVKDIQIITSQEGQLVTLVVTRHVNKIYCLNKNTYFSEKTTPHETDVGLLLKTEFTTTIIFDVKTRYLKMNHKNSCKVEHLYTHKQGEIYRAFIDKENPEYKKNRHAIDEISTLLQKQKRDFTIFEMDLGWVIARHEEPQSQRFSRPSTPTNSAVCSSSTNSSAAAKYHQPENVIIYSTTSVSHDGTTKVMHHRGWVGKDFVVCGQKDYLNLDEVKKAKEEADEYDKMGFIGYDKFYQERRSAQENSFFGLAERSLLGGFFWGEARVKMKKSDLYEETSDRGEKKYYRISYWKGKAVYECIQDSEGLRPGRLLRDDGVPTSEPLDVHKNKAAFFEEDCPPMLLNKQPFVVDKEWVENAHEFFGRYWHYIMFPDSFGGRTDTMPQSSGGELPFNSL